MKNSPLPHGSKTASSHVSLLCVLLATASASAQTWTGGSGNFWSDNANWTSPPVSGPTTDIVFNNAGALTTTNNLGNFSLNTLIQATAGSLGIYHHNNSSLEMAGSNPQISIAGSGSIIGSPLILSGTGNNSIHGTDLTLLGGVSGAGKLQVSGLVTISQTAGTWLGGTEISSGGTLVNRTSISGNIVNNGTLVGNGGSFAGDISGNGNFVAIGGNGDTRLGGINSYTGGSVATSRSVVGSTDSIQGDWSLTNSEITFEGSGTMAGNITGTDVYLRIEEDAHITLTGNNSFTGEINVDYAGTLGIGSDTALGSDATIYSQSESYLEAVGGARTVSNPLEFDDGIAITGSHNLTFTDTTARLLEEGEVVNHNSSGSTAIGGTFQGVSTSQINVNSGSLKLGASVNNGFRMDGEINVEAGATLQMVSNSFVKLGATNLNGGTLIAANGVAIPTGLALNAHGTISGRVASEAGSVIEATGSLSMGDSQSFGGYFSNGELRENGHGVTIMDRNQAVMGSLTTIGQPGTPGTLTAANGIFVDFGRGIEGYGTVVSDNSMSKATIVNGNAAGNSASELLDFTGYVKGVGSFDDVSFSGTFSPGLSPAVVSVGTVILGNSSTLIMEIGGLAPGSQHDQLEIGVTVSLAGTLDVDLINGFGPSLGDSFLILDGTTTGSFASFSFPTIDPGLAWDTGDLYTTGYLNVVAIPEPTSGALMLAGLAGILRRRRLKA